MCVFVCLCCFVCVSLSILKDVFNLGIVVYVIICHCNSQSRCPQPNFLRFANTVFRSSVLCLFHRSLMKCSCDYRVYFYGSHTEHTACAPSHIISSGKIRRNCCAIGSSRSESPKLGKAHALPGKMVPRSGRCEFSHGLVSHLRGNSEK